MKNKSKFFAAVMMASAVAAVSYQTQAATAVGNASALVVGPLSIRETTPMSFGSFSPGATAGTVNTYGATSGGVTAVSFGSFGQFEVTGNATTNYTLAIPSSFNITNGANSMTVTVNAPTTPTTVSATNASGQSVIQVIATLGVAAGQASGLYTGTYNVSVNY